MDKLVPVNMWSQVMGGGWGGWSSHDRDIIGWILQAVLHSTNNQQTHSAGDVPH